MRRILSVLALALLIGLPNGPVEAQPGAKKFPRGAKPITPARLALVPKHKPTIGAPAKFAVIPPQLSMWYNDQTGDCVTAEEAFAKACASIMSGQPELFVPDAEVKRWAQLNGDWDGALLPDVMDQMARSGFVVGGMTYNDGPYTSVDFTSTTALQSAISQGPVKIGVAAAQFDNIAGVGSKNGWYMTKFTQANPSDEDHCVSLCGYGTVGECFQFLNVPLPAGAEASRNGYLLFTWSTIGVIDEASLRAITFEAYLRSPTTVTGQGPVPDPNPNPNPVPVPTPGPAPAPHIFPIFHRPIFPLFGGRSKNCN